jgi:hypothetical protein
LSRPNIDLSSIQLPGGTPGNAEDQLSSQSLRRDVHPALNLSRHAGDECLTDAELDQNKVRPPVEDRRVASKQLKWKVENKPSADISKKPKKSIFLKNLFK